MPVLIVLGWGMALLVLVDRRRPFIPAAQVPWTMAAMVLVSIAMALSLAAVPAAAIEQGVRALVLLIGAWGFWSLSRRDGRSDDGRRR